MLFIMNRHWLDPTSISEAFKIQKEMAESVILTDSISYPPRLIGGMDVSHNRFDVTAQIFASLVILSYPSLAVCKTANSRYIQTFPYIPGLLGFREIPALVKAYQELPNTFKPDVIFVDGHGQSHPRSLGIASHLGVILDIPTIGIAKNILIGTPLSSLEDKPGSFTPLIYKNQSVGYLLKTKPRCRPLIVSAGHKISLERALQLTLSCFNKYRIPEPTRQAHLAANRYRISHQ